MLASLLYGSDKLEETMIKDTIKIPKMDKQGNQIIKDGVPQFKSKTTKTKVIDYNKNFAKSMNVAFGIGHSISKSCTFLPNF